jgi:ParB family chromosome partitioning protein
MTAVSFKQLIQSGEIKRADAMKIPYAALHIEEGFNLRAAIDQLGGEARAEAEAADESLFRHIMAGGQIPPLEVRPRNDGGVWVVDGHRRHHAIGRAIEAGAPIDWVSIVAFAGNDADRCARIITSQEGRKLLPLELAMGYKRLSGFGKTPTEIAAMVGKTPQHVEQMLTLANANNDVHAAVKRGDVSAGVAVGIVRNHGEAAGGVIAEQLGKAKAVGKAKVTAAVVAGPKLPAKEVASLVEELDAFFETLTTEERVMLENISSGAEPTDTVMVSGRALLALMNEHATLTDARNKAAERQREKANKAAQGGLL